MKSEKPGTARDSLWDTHQLEYAVIANMVLCHQHNLSDDMIKPRFNSLNVMYVNQFYALVWAWALTMDAACRLQSAKSKYVDKGPSL